MVFVATARTARDLAAAFGEEWIMPNRLSRILQWLLVVFTTAMLSACALQQDDGQQDDANQNPAANQGRRPNVLLIVVDDMGFTDLGVDWMENATDAQFAVKALKELDAGGGPQSAGWTSWDEVSEDWG
jgi:hypothetical protein